MSRMPPEPTKLQYTRSKGKRFTYEITADRHGAYGVTLGGKILRAVYGPSDYLGRRRFGTKAKEAEAIELAKIDIEHLNGMAEE